MLYAAEKYIVVCSPFAEPLGDREVGVGHYAAEASGSEQGTHVGEIDVAAVIVGEVIAGIFEGERQGWQRLNFPH